MKRLPLANGETILLRFREASWRPHREAIRVTRFDFGGWQAGKRFSSERTAAVAPAQGSNFYLVPKPMRVPRKRANLIISHALVIAKQGRISLLSRKFPEIEIPGGCKSKCPFAGHKRLARFSTRLSSSVAS
jgi:hypothetical protein